MRPVLQGMRSAVGRLLLSVCLAPAARAQDVVVVLLDDVGREDLVEAVAPNIDSLAMRGVRFERAYAMPVCSISRHCLFFGRYPRRDGIASLVDDERAPAADNPTPSSRLPSLPGLTGAHGFETAILGKWHLGQAGLAGPLEGSRLFGPFVHGFDHWLTGSQPSLGDGQGTGYYLWERVDDGAGSLETVYATTAQVDALIEWWSASSSPRFVVLSLNAAHYPYQSPPSSLLPPGTPLLSRYARYLATITAADHELGRFLRAVGGPDQTIVLTSDNGTPDALVPGNQMGKAKGTTFERGIRVPLLVAGPGIARRTSNRLVHLVDLPATIGDLLGLRGAFPDSLSFADELRPELRGSPPRAAVFSEIYGQPFLDSEVAVAGRWKLRRVDPDGPGPAIEVEELYDLQADPLEESPLPAAGVVADELRDFLDGLPPRTP